MDFIVRNLYLSSSEYLTWASDSLISWAMKLLGIFGRIIFNDRILNSTKGSGEKDISKMSSSKISEECSFDLEACEIFFHQLAKIGSKALEYGALEDLASLVIPNREQIEHFRLIVVLSYKMNTRSFASWTKDEWLNGMRELRIHSWEQLFEKRDTFLNLWEDEIVRGDIWRYCYDAGKDNKDMETSLVKALVEVFFMPNWTLWNEFSSYLDDLHVKALTKDQFYSLYDFQKNINCKAHLMDYDFEGAWPTLLDEFVEYLRQKSG